jgi:alpha-ketoglutarate-dependent taurine dioxygenase
MVLRVDAGDAGDGLAESVAAVVLGEAGFCVVENLRVDDDHGALLGLCEGLGTLAVDSMVAVDGEERPVYVQRVEYDPERMLTSDNFVRTSASALEFACHTDCASDRDVPDFVLLHCAQAAESGGESVVVPARSVLAGLEDETVATLRKPVFPFKFGLAPVVEEGAGGLRARYNRLEVDKTVKAGQLTLDDEVLAALDALDAALESAGDRAVVGLRPEDCLVLDNHTMLHGRLPFGSDSGRLLYRARAFSALRRGRGESAVPA